METKYDIIVNFFLNNWYFAIVALICGGLIVIPQIKEGIKMLSSWVKDMIDNWRC